MFSNYERLIKYESDSKQPQIANVIPIPTLATTLTRFFSLLAYVYLSHPEYMYRGSPRYTSTTAYCHYCPTAEVSKMLITELPKIWQVR
jgi:hypothetical protein